MKNSYSFLCPVVIFLVVFSCSGFAKDTPAFRIKAGKRITVLCDTLSEAKVVSNALNLWGRDCRSVLSIAPKIVSGEEEGEIWIGTLGESDVIRRMLSENYISVSELSGKKEAFLMRVVRYRSKPVLIVAGSDKRGTAYGILEISRLMGVSPWEWWADATPAPLDEFTLSSDYFSFQAPSVEFRGIFINDEDWGFMPWSTKTYEPTNVKGQIGPRTHQRVFELLLRLRANTFWPAMHSCSHPFFLTPGNKEVADDYGIYIGTSHCEPMLRNANGEWRLEGEGEYDYVNNRENVYRFWEKRVTDVAGQDNIYTLGIRGIHDGKMQGAKTIAEQKNALTRIFADQRDLLKRYIHNDVTKIPQVFIPYKEVLEVYHAGLEVPADVTLMWCDDNFGYIRHFPDSIEKRRSGGNAVYYHVSYWGSPHDYLWLATAHPSLVYEQMKTAYNSGIQKMWILNVGDIKPAEYQMELFLDMAWDMKRVENEGVTEYMRCWLEREFGADCARRLLPVMQEHYRLSHICKPEHMGNTRVDKKSPSYLVISDLPWSEKAIKERLTGYDNLAREVERIGNLLPDYKRDAYFQLVKYPVQAAAQMNRKLLKAQLARHELAKWEESDVAFDSIVSLTRQYNSLKDGKWNLMMDMAPRRLPVFKRVPRERATVPLRKEYVALYSFSGADYTDSSEQQICCSGLGHSGKSLALRKGSSVTYRLGRLPVDSVRLEIRLLPNHPVDGNKLRLNVTFDDSSERLIEYQTKEKSEEWKENVLRNQAIRWMTLPVDNKAHHILTLKALDEGIIVDQIFVYDAREF